MSWINGYKTYIVAIVGILVNGAYAMGYLDQQQVVLIDGVLGMLGLGTIRHAIARMGK